MYLRSKLIFSLLDYLLLSSFRLTFFITLLENITQSILQQ